MTAPRLSPADPNYEWLKRQRAIDTAGLGAGSEGISFTPGDPAGWFEADPETAGGLIYHPPAGIAVDADNLLIPWSSNFVPDPSTPGAGVVLQIL